MDMKIIDKVLPDKEFNELQKIITSSDFPWFFSESNDYNNGWHLSHLVFDNGHSTSWCSNIVLPLLEQAISKTGKKIKEIFRVRIFLLLNVNLDHIPHIDGAFNHQVGILYLNDSDGSTKILNAQYDPFSMMSGRDYYNNFVKDKYKIDLEVEPTANRLLSFDGMTYHVGSNPTINNKRYIINFNYSFEE
jgi:hypothetical protein